MADTAAVMHSAAVTITAFAGSGAVVVYIAHAVVVVSVVSAAVAARHVDYSVQSAKEVEGVYAAWGS